jgi:hypothetical protein
METLGLDAGTVHHEFGVVESMDEYTGSQSQAALLVRIMKHAILERKLSLDALHGILCIERMVDWAGDAQQAIEVVDEYCDAYHKDGGEESGQ